MSEVKLCCDLINPRLGTVDEDLLSHYVAMRGSLNTNLRPFAID